AGLEQKLELQTLLIREERVFSLIPERLETLTNIVDELLREVPLDTTFLSERSLNGLPNRDLISGLQSVVDEIRRRGVSKRSARTSKEQSERRRVHAVTTANRRAAPAA